MIKDKEYVRFLKAIISCINYGDYYSVKELSYLELEKTKKKIEDKKKNKMLIKNQKRYILKQTRKK